MILLCKTTYFSVKGLPIYSVLFPILGKIPPDRVREQLFGEEVLVGVRPRSRPGNARWSGAVSSLGEIMVPCLLPFPPWCLRLEAMLRCSSSGGFRYNLPLRVSSTIVTCSLLCGFEGAHKPAAPRIYIRFDDLLSHSGIKPPRVLQVRGSFSWGIDTPIEYGEGLILR